MRYSHVRKVGGLWVILKPEYAMMVLTGRLERLWGTPKALLRETPFERQGTAEGFTYNPPSEIPCPESIDGYGIALKVPSNAPSGDGAL